MKRFVLLSILNLSLIISLMAQNSVKKQNLPKENSKVTREYDEKGNLTKFDSVYTYSWSGDTTMTKQFVPEDLSKIFGNGFEFFSDSTRQGKSFFDDFDQFFAQPFGGVKDSAFVNQFKHFHQFKDLQFPNDSMAFNFGFPDEFMGNGLKEKSDSIQSKHQLHSSKNQPKSMEEMMQMFQQQFREMEKRNRQFFEGNQKSKEF